MAPVYTFDPAAGIYTRSGYLPTYEPSDAPDIDRVREAVLRASDRSSGSTELEAAIDDWPTFYHLSCRRANLLRPVRRLFAGCVLEAGCGCGVLTRYLAESGAEVAALDASGVRAPVAALRCADLPNVRVFAENLRDFEPEALFATVLCVGVLEYAPLHFHGADPIASALESAARLLDPDEGTLVIAIENQLGLRYFAGFPEEHTNAPYYGIQDLYSPSGPVTIGRRDWTRKLERAGFESIDFLLPFPDYKSPTVVLTPWALDDPRLDLGDVIRNAISTPYRQAQPAFLESAAWPAIARNGLIADLANSFLIVASRKRRDLQLLVPGLAYIYSGSRLPRYAREKVILDCGGVLAVYPRPLYSRPSGEPELYEQKFDEEPFLQGRTHDASLPGILLKPGWTVEELAAWALPWIEFLRSKASRSGQLPGNYVDCTPFNLIDTGSGLVPFDLEYVPQTPLPIEFVLFRGLWSSLMRAGLCAEPRPGVSRSPFRLTKEVLARAGVALAEAECAALIRMEADLQHAITGARIHETERRIRDSVLPIAATACLSRYGVPTSRCQLFWRSADSDFDEDRSVLRNCPVVEQSVPVSLAIPLQPKAPAALRFDPADRCGVLADLHVTVFDSSGALLWSMDRAADAAGVRPLRDMLFLDPAPDGSALAVLMGEDASFEIALKPEQSRRLAQGGRLDCRFRWLLSGEAAPGPAAEHRDARLAETLERLDAEAVRLRGRVAECEAALGRQQQEKARLANALSARERELDALRQALESFLANRRRLLSRFRG